MNLTCVFAGEVCACASGDAKLKIAASTIYTVELNGNHIAWGPARCGHGTYRVDEWPIGQYLNGGVNSISITVAGYNVNCFAYLDQPSFLQAEVVQDGTVTLYTGKDGGFDCRIDLRRIQRSQRYSFQRGFTEAYDYTAQPAGAVMAETEEKHLTARNVPLSEFRSVFPSGEIGSGRMTVSSHPKPMVRNLATVGIGEKIKGFRPEELDAFLTSELGAYDFLPGELRTDGEGYYLLYSFRRNTTGFLDVEFEVKSDCTLFAAFDEKLTGGDIDYSRLSCVNIVCWKLNAGTHHLVTIEPYTLKYLKLACTSGDFRVHSVSIVEYKGNLPIAANPAAGDEALSAVYEAAAETLLQNSTDLFMDCPSRERAGWLCDSFFTARGECAVTGRNVIEHNYLENFLFANRYRFLPEGMIPMCYPADHYDGVFIPNWAMWLVLELNDYRMRSGDAELPARFEKKVSDLLAYFKRFENEDELLVNLKGWIFIDWSRANDKDLVDGVSFPSNMLYASMLKAAGRLYGDGKLIEKGEKLISTIRSLSYNGSCFADHADYASGIYRVSGTVTEACQSYAFFTGTAEPQLYPELWRRLKDGFAGEENNKLCPQNAFIGFYIRMAALEYYGAFDEIERDIRRVFYPQAVETGTLWEQMDGMTSRNHGFAAYAAELIQRIMRNKNGVSMQ